MNSIAHTISFSTENQTEKAIKIWSGFSPIKRLQIMNEIGANKYKQMSRMYNACINHISQNLEDYA